MSKTIIAALVSIISGLVVVIGGDFSEETRELLTSNLEAVVAGVTIIYGIGIAILRKLTTKPLAGGLAGFFGKKES